MTANAPLRSRDIQASFPRSLQFEAGLKADQIVKKHKINLGKDTLKKIVEQGCKIFDSLKNDLPQGKFSSKESLVQQCFRDIWAESWTEEVLNEIRPLKDDIDYCLVQDVFEEGLKQVKFEIEHRFNEISDQKASSLYKKINFPFDVKEIVDEKIQVPSKIKHLQGLRDLFPSKKH